MASVHDDTMQTLCLELAVMVAKSTWPAVSPDFQADGFLYDYGEKASEWGCGAMVQVGVYRRRAERGSTYDLLIPPDQVRTALASRTFDEDDLDVLLLALCYRSIETRDEMGGWGEPFEVPDHLRTIVAALEAADFIELADDMACWRAKALPWLLEVGALDLDDLPAADPEAAAAVWRSMPEELKRCMPEGPVELSCTELRFYCTYRTADGWSMKTTSTVPSLHWDVPEVYAALRLGEAG